MMDAPATWFRLQAFGPSGAEIGAWEFRRDERPDLGDVETVALMRLAAGRTGAVAVVLELSPALAGLLELAGLGQMGREPEQGEERSRVEEGVVDADPPA